MSLLEDVFLQDEADEAQDLERVIEGDEYEEIRRQNSDEDDDDGGVGRDDEAEEDKRRVDPNSTKTKREVRNPRFVLNPARLTGPRGIHVIPEHFKDFKFKGKGYEKEDLDLVLKKLEHWAYRLYPKFKFADCLKKMETLGKKRPVMVNLHKIRSDQFVNDEEAVVQKDSSDDEAPPPPEDEFDKLLQQQIELARNTPGRTPARPQFGHKNDISTPFSMPKATSSPSISEEQKQRMIENRKKAEARRLARLQNAENGEIANSQNPENGKIGENAKENVPRDVEIIENGNEESVGKKRHNKSNVIDSSDEENDYTEGNGTKIDEKSPVVDEIDLTEVGKTKKVRSQVIDSDEDLAEKRDMESVQNEEIEEIDLTEVTNNKKNKSRVLDSDDEMDINTKVGEIDLTNVNQYEKSNRHIMNGEEIDLTNNITPKNAEKSLENEKNPLKGINNVVDSDSSDDECNVTATNVSITVDVHKTNSAEITKDLTVNSEEINKNGEDFDLIDTMNEDNVTEKESSAENVLKSPMKHTEVVEKTIESEINVNEIMDVDFSEAF